MSEVAMGSYHRIRVVENANGLYEWILYLSPQTRKASARSPRHYDSAWKARDEAKEFARKWSKILKNNYSVVDKVTNSPTLNISNGVPLVTKGNVEVEDLVGDRRSRGVEAEIENFSDVDLLAMKSLMMNGVSVDEVSLMFKVDPATARQVSTMGVL